SVTGKPELAVGKRKENGASHAVRAGNAPNVIDCAVGSGTHATTTKLRVTVGAAENVPLPACEAAITTVPAAPVSVTVLPAIVAGPLDTTSVTARPEDAVGETTVKTPSHAV